MLNVTAREKHEMNPVALLTPTYGRDLELCTLLCESVDRHVTSFSKHYLLVPDCDLALFSRFESQRREVLPASQFLPKWLRPLPRIVQRKRRQYWWSFRTKPVSGWHVQQYLKIAAREPARVVLIEGDHSIKEVHEQIVAAVAERITGLGTGAIHP